MTDKTPHNSKPEIVRDGDRVLRKADEKSAGENVTSEKQADRYQQNFVSFSDGTLAVSPLVIEDGFTGERLYDARKLREAEEDISQSATTLKALAKHNPVLEPVEKLREHADNLKPGPEKDKLTELARNQAAELSPEMKAHYEAGTHKALSAETITNTPEGWLTVAQKIAQLPMDKQLEVIGAGLVSGMEQYQHDEHERSLGQLIGTVQGTGEVLQGLAKIADFGAACILGDNERAGKMGEEFGTALGQTILGGVRLFQAADQYLFNIGFTGDCGKPFRDIAAAGQKLDEQWSQLPPREQERIKAKLITEMVESGAIRAGGANAVQKASKFTEVLDALAVEAKQFHAAAKPAIKKAVKAVNNAVDELLQPVGDTGMGVKMPIPKDSLKDETKMLMSKADGMGEYPKHSEKGVKGEPVAEKYTPPKWFAAELTRILERLSPAERSFIADHGIKIVQVRRIAPEKGNLGAFYDFSENTIYVPEEVLRLKKPIPNYDLEFAFRHEFGHAFNAKRDPFGDYISNLKPFREAINEDLKRIPPNKLTELQLRFPTDEQLRDEVFADMYAHACGLQSNNPRSMLMKDLFPNCLNFVQEMPRP